MADSSSPSLSRLFSSQTDTEIPHEHDDEDELNDEDYIRILLDNEIDNNYIESYVNDSIKINRSEAIQWIFNVRII